MKRFFYLIAYLITVLQASAQAGRFETVISVGRADLFVLKTGTKVIYKQYCDPQKDSVITNGMVTFKNCYANGIKCTHIMHFRDTLLQRQYIISKSKKQLWAILQYIDPAIQADTQTYYAFWKSLPKGRVLRSEKADYIIFKTGRGWVMEF
ncbi:MAG: hypothetical protein ACT6QS_00345 [Flavobacteriales bacterium]